LTGHRILSPTPPPGEHFYLSKLKEQMVMKIYVHADLDAFFASAEVLKTPSLRGRAFVVGSESYRERYRGVALTATYEARVYGIRSGMSIAECYRRCPTLLYREPDHPLYRRLSERVMTILSGFTNNLIQTSVDEAYMVFDGEVEDVIRTCREMKSFVKEKTGLTMSVGGGATPIIAKIASSLSKPNGLLIIPPGKEAESLMNAPIGVVPGIGSVSQRRLAKEGIRTIGDLYAAGRGKAWELAGGAGVNIINVLDGIKGVEGNPFLNAGPRKSFSRQRRWYPPEGVRPREEECIGIWMKIIKEISYELTEDLKMENAMASVITLALKGRMGGISRSKKIPVPTWSGEKLFQLSRELFIKELKRGCFKARDVRRISLRFSVGRRIPMGQRRLDEFRSPQGYSGTSL